MPPLKFQMVVWRDRRDTLQIASPPLLLQVIGYTDTDAAGVLTLSGAKDAWLQCGHCMLSLESDALVAKSKTSLLALLFAIIPM